MKNEYQKRLELSEKVLCGTYDDVSVTCYKRTIDLEFTGKRGDDVTITLEMFQNDESNIVAENLFLTSSTRGVESFMNRGYISQLILNCELVNYVV